MNDPKRLTFTAHMEVSQSTIPETGPLDEDGIEVEGMPSSGAAGLFIHRLLALFAKALNLSIKEDTVVSGSDILSFDHGMDDQEGERLDNDDDDITQMPPSLCGLFLCLGMDDPNSLKADHSRSSMMKSTELIRKILHSSLRIVMDLKSRQVPPRVWGHLVDNLRSQGLVVDGLCSFDICELRSISSYSCSPVKAIILFHSAGDLQKACIANEIKPGDTVYFNAGSLLLKKRYSIMEAASIGCCQGPTENTVGYDTNMDLDEIVSNHALFQPFAFGQHKQEAMTGQVECKSTIEDFQKKYDLKIGVYIQEFCISRDVLNSVVQFINDHPSIYNLGIAWGGINGSTVNGLSGDGYWKQRYVGNSWNFSVEPPTPVKMLETAPDSDPCTDSIFSSGSIQ